MMARAPVAVVVLALTLAAGTGGDKAGAEQPRPAPPGKGQDVILLGAERPVLFRFHIEVDGRPLHEAHREATERYLKALFRFLDRDGDGFLSEAEARHVPPPLVPLPGGDSDFVHVAHNFRALDVDGDGKVSYA